MRIRDQLGRTGADFTYRIEITEKTPALAATLPTVERNVSQKWKTFSVPRGNRYAAVVNVVRENISCAAEFVAGPLPGGVTMHCAPISKAVTTFPVVFEAAADAPIFVGGGDLGHRHDLAPSGPQHLGESGCREDVERAEQPG